MAGYYYSNPYWGGGMENLAGALFPDPSMNVRMGLLGDQRRMTQAQRRKLDSEAISQEITNRETQAALAQLAELVAQGGPIVPGLGGASPVAGILARTGIAGGQDVNNVSDMLSELMIGQLAQGPDDQRAQALTMQGKALGYRDAVSPTMASQVHGRQLRSDEGTARYEADQKLAGDKYGADQKLAGDKYAADSEARTSRANTAYESTMDLYGTIYEANMPSGSKSGSRRGAGGKDGTVAVDKGLAEQIAVMIDDHEANAGATIGPKSRPLVEKRAGEIYQQTQNLPGAVAQAIAEMFPGTPLEVSGPGKTAPAAPAAPGKRRVVTDPAEQRKILEGVPKMAPGQWDEMEGPAEGPAGMYPGTKVNPQEAIAQAQAAIQQGAPREAVIARLKQMGIDPQGL